MTTAGKVIDEVRQVLDRCGQTATDDDAARALAFLEGALLMASALRPIHAPEPVNAQGLRYSGGENCKPDDGNAGGSEA